MSFGGHIKRYQKIHFENKKIPKDTKIYTLRKYETERYVLN